MEKLKSCQGCFWYAGLLGVCVNNKSIWWHSHCPDVNLCDQYYVFTKEEVDKFLESNKFIKYTCKKIIESIPKEELERMLNEARNGVINNGQG